jgi:hypothetical protein
MDLQIEIACQTKKNTGINSVGKSIGDYDILPTK